MWRYLRRLGEIVEQEVIEDSQDELRWEVRKEVERILIDNRL